MLLLACIDGMPFAHFVELNTVDNSTTHHIYNASGLELTIQQYTGLKDRNGKEIYEGDIVVENHDGGEGESNIGRVFFAAGTFMIDGDGPLYEHTYSLTPDILEDYLVIGNIFENPDLLK
jgi:uncharacterized phage protein (TIGR01671 family)